ncbi:18707_t:CDS:2, partial [Acaulospora morrowiae]
QFGKEDGEYGKENQYFVELAINDEVAERQDKIEKQIEHMGRMLSDLLENGQSAITKKRQQPQRQ